MGALGGCTWSEPILKIILINGASGVGKTTLASALSKRLCEVGWICPDQIWDVESKGTRRFLELSVERARTYHQSITLIDCQARRSDIQAAIELFPGVQFLEILVTCQSHVRRARLERRLGINMSSAEMTAMDEWAALLDAETLSSESIRVDTTHTCKTHFVSFVIEQLLRVVGLQTAKNTCKSTIHKLAGPY